MTESVESDVLTPQQYLKAVKAATQKCAKASEHGHSPVSLLPDLRLLDAKLSVPPLPDRFQPSKEWSAKLIQWFAHARHHFSCLPRPADPLDLKSVLRSIESQEYPKVAELQSLADCFGIIAYFDSRNAELSHCDLFWVFAALLFIDRLFSPPMSMAVQNVRDLQLRQLSRTDASDPRVPYLVVIVTLIEKYFNQ
jgi:hypothetical protein